MPAGIVSTGYPAVRDRLRDAGIVHDDWQQGLGRLILGKRADGKYAATVGGVVLSIPRQVGKTFTVGTIIFALCLLFPGLTVIWTAHHTRTSDETFGAMQGIAKRAKIFPHVDGIRRANGQQAIFFRNGSRILFGAREQGFGRGFAEVDVEVFDEAQILNERALEDMVAATNQAKHPAGALLFYMGTPPRPVDPGEAFSNKRAKALLNKVKDVGDGFGDMVYVELSADPGSNPDDRAQWGKANPSFPKRTPVESIERLRENVGSDESFLREGLGIWDETTSVLSPAKWSRLADMSAAPTPHIGKVVLAVDTDQQRASTTITVAGVRADGVPLVAVIDSQPGVDWAVKRIVERVRDATKPAVACVVIDKRSQAKTLIEPLEQARIKVVAATAGDMAEACGVFYDAVMETGHLRHPSDPALNLAVKHASTRPLLDAWAWDKRSPSVDITPLVAGTLALWGHINKSGPPKNAGKGRVVVMV